MDVLDKPAKQSPDLVGTAYGRSRQHHNSTITEVMPGTPCGEFLRRYWHPVAVSQDVTTRPSKIKLLGEELILFRDGKGKAGLLYPRCMHRGTSLFYGHVEERGIRCCYHGWLFDAEGNCLEQPCEPDGGLRRDVARQPWYPVQERYGLVFAYLGPPDKMPVLPRYDILEDLKDGEFVQARGGASLAYFDPAVEAEQVPYNWLQAWENSQDPYHVWVLHSTFSGAQFAGGFGVMPKVEFERHGQGAIYHAYRTFEDGRSLDRVTYSLLPNIASVPSIELKEGLASSMTWWVPTEDAGYVIFSAVKTRKELPPFGLPLTPDGKTWSQMSEQEHQDYPSDFEAQWGQGAITLHSEEHFVQSDRGVATLRRLLTQQIKAVQNGEDPLGVSFDENAQPVKIVAGNYYR